MSTDVLTHAGQAEPGGRDLPDRQAGDAPAQAFARQEPHVLIQESIKYRRRAQDAERRAETLDAEVQQLRQAQNDRAAALEAELAQARADADTMRRRVEAVEVDRRLERELAQAGCGDIEAGLAVAHARLADASPPEDLAAFARGILAEKPHLRAAGSAPRPAIVPGSLPPPSAGAKPDNPGSVRRAVERMADRARETGNLTDVLTYMRARRARAG